MNAELKEYKDFERCKKCGGQCCRLYRCTLDGGSMPVDVGFENWVAQWDEEFEKSGAVNVEPLHDPLTSHLRGNEHIRKKLLEKGIDIDFCQYNKNGCILPWELRPKSCTTYRCIEWKEEIQKRPN